MEGKKRFCFDTYVFIVSAIIYIVLILFVDCVNSSYSGTCPSCGGVPKVVTNNTRHYLQCWQCGKCILVLHDKKCGDKCIIKAEGVE